jgi:oligoribonuclease NrnB/cAMP/cGMP phosphodiesterase (DHH superfamily)
MRYVIYHADCPDGFGAAYAAWKRFGDRAEYVALRPGDPLPDLRGADVLIADISWPRPEMLRVAAEARDLVVLDHHKTAEQELRDLPFAHFDMARSGAVITWDYLHDAPAPPLLRYIQDRDLWRWELPDARQVLSALDSYPMDFSTWDRLEPQALVAEGRAIERYIEQQLQRLLPRARLRAFEGHNVPVINSPIWSSDLGARLGAGYPFAVIWSEDGDGYRVFSLRSPPDGLDVGELARRFGGGGHAHSAGFRLPPSDEGPGTKDESTPSSPAPSRPPNKR